MAYNAILSQEIAWFDQPKNSAGALCARLADDAANVQGVSLEFKKPKYFNSLSL